jgi:hypothetical protein
MNKLEKVPLNVNSKIHINEKIKRKQPGEN